MHHQTRVLSSRLAVLPLLLSLVSWRSDAVDLSVGVNIDVSRSAAPDVASQPQFEVSVAVDPRNSDRIFVLSNHRSVQPTRLFAARSSSRGVSWNPSGVFSVSGSPAPSRDPSVTWDGFGNLYAAYTIHDADAVRVGVARSRDGGATFSLMRIFEPPRGARFADQPTIVAGPGEIDARSGTRKEALWLTYHVVTNVEAEGAPNHPTLALIFGFPKVHSAEIRGAGPSDVGPFDREHEFDLRGVSADVAIGPSGEVLVAYSEADRSSASNRRIAICRDPDGRGPLGFAPCTSTPFESGVSRFPELNIGYDRSHATQARAYLSYVHEAPRSGDANLLMRSCEASATAPCDVPANWSAAEVVNDDSSAARQSLPWMEVDPASGLVALSWVDTREDPTHKSAELYAAVREPGAAGRFSPNRRVSTLPGAWNAEAQPGAGDYTGQSFFAGTFFASWADDSQAAGNFDAFIAGVSVRAGPDGDADGIADSIDDCSLHSNPNQVDADLDGYGNRCDADFDQTNSVTPQDLEAFRSCLGSSPGDPNCAEMDLDADGSVEPGDDLAIFTALAEKAPGPSGSKCAELPPRDRSCL